MSEATPESDKFIVKILLLVCSLTLPTSLFFVGYFFYQRQEIAGVKSKLLSELELQTELLAGQPLYQSLMPHSIAEIGYVLNPFMKRSSYKAYEGDSYPVNSLGLRGPEIAEKQPGVRRFLIVGDSVAFGWKLKEPDRLSSILNRRISENSDSAGEFEFITVALPGWNVRSASAFLKSHLPLLDPDLILWWSINNDIADTHGVIPPGISAAWASSQDEADSPFVFISQLNKRGGSFMPILEDRRARNINLIASFEEEHNIPIVLLGLPGFDERTSTQGFDPPWIKVPGKYRFDDRWKLSPIDAHPSPWANEVLAVGVLRKLSILGAIPSLSWSENDREIVKDFDREEEKLGGSQETHPRDYSSQLAQIPSKYEGRDGRDSKSVVFGISSQGLMARAGCLFLRNPGGSKRITLSIAPPPGIQDYPGSAVFSVRSRSRQESQETVVIDSELVKVSLSVPAESDDPGVYEVSWLFDYTLCSRPDLCHSGALLHAGFE